MPIAFCHPGLKAFLQLGTDPDAGRNRAAICWQR
jgi:hypothetical protein